MVIKRRIGPKPRKLKDKLEDIWVSRDIGNYSEPAQWEENELDVYPAQVKSYLAEFVKDYAGECDSHVYEANCEFCQVRREYKSLLRKAATSREDQKRLRFANVYKKGQ